MSDVQITDEDFASADPDLAEALKELTEAEQAQQAKGEGEPKPEAKEQPAEAEQNAEAKQEPKPEEAKKAPEGEGEEEDEIDEQGRVPHQALHSERKKRQQAEQRIKELEQNVSRIDTLEKMLAAVVSGKGGSEKPADPRAKAQEIEAAIEEVWKKVDEGEIPISQARATERKLEAMKADLLRPPPADPVEMETRLKSDPFYQQQIQRLESQNPWLGSVPVPLLQALAPQAHAVLRQHGVAYRPGDPSSDIRFRMALVAVAKDNGLDKLGAAPAPAAEQPKPAEQSQPKASPEQVRQKLDLAAKQPPMAPGTGPAVDDTVKAKVEKLSVHELMTEMSDEELMKAFQG